MQKSRGTLRSYKERRGRLKSCQKEKGDWEDVKKEGDWEGVKKRGIVRMCKKGEIEKL